MLGAVIAKGVAYGLPLFSNNNERDEDVDLDLLDNACWYVLFETGKVCVGNIEGSLIRCNKFIYLCLEVADISTFEFGLIL